MGSDRNDAEKKVYVGGLSSETTSDSLEKHFSQYGEIADCIVMMEKHENRSRGFGFVTFKDSASAATAIGAANTVDGRDVSTKKATRETSRPGSSPQEPGGAGLANVNTVKIFVGGLPASCPADKLEEHFSKYGKITDAVVMMDNATQRHRGFGYCTFEDSAAVEAVMAEYKDHRIDGKWVECKRCIPQDKMRDNDRGRGSDRDRHRDNRDDRSSSGVYSHPGGAPGYPGYAPNDPYAAWYAHAAACQARGEDPYAAYYAQQQQAYGAYGYPAQGGYPGYPGGYPGAYGMPAYGGAPPATAASLEDGPSRHRESRHRRRDRSRSRSLSP